MIDPVHGVSAIGMEHLVAQERGKQVWYDAYRVRVATVARDYGKLNRG